MKNESDGSTLEYQGKKPWTFAVESNFIRNTQLSLQCRALYLILQSYLGPKCAAPWPKINTLISYANVQEDTLRGYLKDLVHYGWLRIEHRRKEFSRFDSNVYILLDGDPDVKHPRPKDKKSAFGKPSSENRGTAFPSEVPPSLADRGYKCTHVKSTKIKEGTKRPFGPRSTSSNTAPSGTVPAPPAVLSPSAPSLGPQAPNPAGTEEDSPEKKAHRFISNFRGWAECAELPSSVSQKDKEVVQAFFQDNPKEPVRDLTAIMLAAWMMDETALVDEKDQSRLRFWYCAMKSRRLVTFIKHMSEIQDEICWRGEEEQKTKVFRKAKKRWVHSAAVDSTTADS